MVYLLALLMIQAIVLALVFPEISRQLSGGLTRGSQLWSVARTLGLIMPAVLLSMPLAIDLFKIRQFEVEGATGFGTTSIDAWLCVAGGLLALVVFAVRLWRRRQLAPTFWGAGAHVLGVLIGLYMLGVGVDQLRYVGDGSAAGAVTWSYFRDNGVRDMSCPKETILVRRIDDSNVRYRCPTLLMLGQFSAAPLVPWPDYVEGESPQLALALHKLESEAIQVPSSSVVGVEKPL